MYGSLLRDDIQKAFYITDNEEGRAFKVIPETIGQFTGLYDKNGKEIYEGDIVQQYNIKANGIVEYKYGQFGVNALGMFWNIHSTQTEVIGNTTDNPELLEGE